MRVREVFLVMREAPLCHDRPAARDDAGDAARGHGDVAQQHARMDGEVIDALFRLLDQRVAIDLPREIFRPATRLLERLVNGHGADRDGRVPNDPLARLMDVLPRRQIHHGVGAPQRRPPEFVDFLLDRRADCGIADVRVDLHREVAADDHRLELGMVDVRGNDRAAARDLGSDELGIEPLPDRDERHLGRDDACARVVELRDRLGTPARGHPGFAQFREALADVVPLRSAGVVYAQRLAVGQCDLAHRHAHTRRTVDVELP